MTSERVDTPPPAGAVFRAEFARMLGVKETTVTHHLQMTLAGHPKAPVGFPAPGGYTKVPTETKSGLARATWAPWWHRADAETYQRTKRPVGQQGHLPR